MAAGSLLLPTLALVLLAVTCGTSLSPCHVDCSHFGMTADNFADDPMDCHKYYRCFGATTWSMYPFDCEEGENFDTVSKTCKTEGYLCSPSCQRCSFSCDNPVMGKAAMDSDCSTFYYCSDPLEPHQCPADSPYFDGYACQTDIHQCCSCRAECSLEDALSHNYVQDYLNCTNYYLCLAPGVPEGSTHGHCPVGTFDAALGECVESGLCEAPCLKDPANNETCVTDMRCQEIGFFPRCTGICDPYYFHCTEADIGYVIQPYRCPTDYVVDPIKVICIHPEFCPVRQKDLTQRR